MYELDDFRSWEDYLWPGTEVLRNKLGLRDPVELEAAEPALSYGRLVELRAGGRVSGRFDLVHLQAIHACVFPDVYEWAGRVRTLA